MTTEWPTRPTGQEPAPAPFRGGSEGLRAMKRALARAPLGPTATLALTHAILDLEAELDGPLSTSN